MTRPEHWDGALDPPPERVAPGPLAGVRVLDLTQIVAGPTAAFYLASLGAEVIRVEPPGGDLTWRVGPYTGPRGLHDGPRRDDEIALGTIKRNRGKRSMVLDLKSDAGREILLRLVDVSDVVIENLRPGVLDRLGIGWPVLSVRNPRVVVCSMSGFGQFGPSRDRQAMDLTMQAITGVQAKTGFPDGPPTRSGLLAGDLGPATFAVLGVVAALFERERTGVGQHVDVAMHDVLTSWLWDDQLDRYEDQGREPRTGNSEPRGVPSDTYRASDDWVNVLVVNDEQWKRLSAHIGRPDLAVHATNAQRVGARGDIDAAIASWCAARAAREVEEELLAIEVPVAVVEPPWVARHDPHARARRSLVPMVDHLGHDTGLLGPRFPVHFSAGEPRLGPPEALGSSTEAVLRALLEADDATIGAWRAGGAFGAGDAR